MYNILGAMHVMFSQLPCQEWFLQANKVLTIHLN